MNVKDYWDLGMRIFHFKRKPVLILDTIEKKLCFNTIKPEALTTAQNIPTATDIQWESCRYLSAKEWHGFLIDGQNEQFIKKLIDDFYFTMLATSLKKITDNIHDK